MSIKIGDNNKIKKSNIIDYNNSTVSSKDTPKEDESKDKKEKKKG